MAEWADAAKSALADGEPCALVSILAIEGSAPRGAGTRMLVTEHAVVGTIGGGALEMQAIGQGRAALAHAPGAWRVQDYPLGPLLGQCCGGRVRLLVERIDPNEAGWIGQEGVLASRFGEGAIGRRLLDPAFPVARLPARGPMPVAGDEMVERLGEPVLPVYLFGAGHVGVALAQSLAPLPIGLSWFDTREEDAEKAGAAFVERERVADCVAEAPAEAAILIMTHDHALDYDLTRAALNADVRFVGLIGSATKRARFLSRLDKEGIDTARLTCPIGVEGVVGKAPAIIAIAVAAQLMQLYGAAA